MDILGINIMKKSYCMSRLGKKMAFYLNDHISAPWPYTIKRTALNSCYGMWRCLDPRWGMTFWPLNRIGANSVSSGILINR